MCNERSLFSTFFPLPDIRQIRFGNEATVNTKYAGKVAVGGLNLEALYVPQLRVSLLSVSQLDHLGYTLQFQDGVCYLSKVQARQTHDATGPASCKEEPPKSIFAHLINGLYQVIGTPSTGLQYGKPISYSALHTGCSISKIYKNEDWNRWHCRFGHLGDLALSRILENPSASVHSGRRNYTEATCQDYCTTCIRAKHKRTYSKATAHRATRPFELLHSDSCGPLPPSKSGARYFILFVDDYSRKAFTYFLIQKNSESCTSAFKELLSYLQSHYPNFPVARFRSDNGRGEYANTKFQSLLSEYGITFEPSTPHSPHQNGVAERMIQTLSTRARAVMLDAGVPIDFWAEVINTAVYLQQWIPSSALDYRCPKIVLECSTKSSDQSSTTAYIERLQHLRRVGCVAYRRIPDEDMISKTHLKFGPRSRLCMMLGYGDSEKIWKLWDFEGNGGRGRPVFSSDVRFVETENAWEMRYGSASEETTEGDMFKSYLDQMFDGSETQLLGGKRASDTDSGGTHQGSDASPGTMASGMHLTGDLSLVGLETCEAESGSNHIECEASPEQQHLKAASGSFLSKEASLEAVVPDRAGGMHFGDDVSPEGLSDAREHLSAGGIHHPGDLSPVVHPSPLVETDKTLPERPEKPVLSTRRSTRIRKRPRDTRDYEVLTGARPQPLSDRSSQPVTDNTLLAISGALLEGQMPVDPDGFEDAWNSPLRELWIQAMREEVSALESNQTWEITTGIPHNCQPIGSRWIFRTKPNPDGSTRYKARLVIKGYEQRYGTDYNETYAPVGRLEALRILLTLASQQGLTLHHLDVVTAFLNPRVDRDNLYMILPDGVEKAEPSLQPQQVVRLRKALYGLKQAPRLWYREIDSFLMSLGFAKSLAEPNLYILDRFLFLLLYVDDMLLAYQDKAVFESILVQLKDRYQITDLGRAQRFLGLEIVQLASGEYRLSQTEYIKDVLHRFGMANANPVSTPLAKDTSLDVSATRLDNAASQKEYMSIIGSLMYTALGTRPDITFAVTKLSQYNHDPRTTHMTAAKRVLRYLKYSQDLGLVFRKDSDLTSSNLHKLHAYTDADWAGNPQDRKSISGYVFFLGAPISWKSKRQSIIATSTTEAEFTAFLDVSKQALWLRQLLEDIHYGQEETIKEKQTPRKESDSGFNIESNVAEPPYPPYAHGEITIFSDSERAIANVKGEGITARNKHFDIRLLKSRELQEHQVVNFTYVPSKLNRADGFTKGLDIGRHTEFIVQLQLE